MCQGGAAPPTQVQPQTEQDTAQGDSAAPLETGTRSRTDAERQWTAEAKAAREAALVKLNRERQQKRIIHAQELTRCLSTGMGLWTPEQVRQITNAVTGTDNEPMDALRSFNERLEILREENPHASNANVRGCRAGINCRSEKCKRTAAEAGNSANGGCVRGGREGGKEGGKRYTFQNRAGRPARISLDPLPAGRWGERNPRSSRCTITSVESGPICTRQSGTATRISSEATAELSQSTAVP
jgi:hypothetical protein